MARAQAFRVGLLAAAVAAALAALPAAARDDTIAVTGAPAPGLPAGVNFSFFGSSPQLNNAGQVAFFSVLTGTGVDGTNEQAIYRDTALIAREGNPAPGLAGANFSAFGAPQLNNAGQVAFLSFLTGLGVDFTNDRAIYRDTALIARSGNPAPGLGVNFSSFGTPQLNNVGQVAFLSFLTGTGVDSTNDSAIYRDTALIAREGNPAPGLAGANFSGFSSNIQLNNVGQVAFWSLLTGTGVGSTNDTAIYRDTTLIAREGNAAPGLPAGVNFSGFSSSPQLNNVGQVAFHGSLTGTGVSSINDTAIYRDTALIAREGNPAPGLSAGVNFSGFGNPQLNDAGQVAFWSLLTGTGVDFTNDRAIYRDTTLIAREGNAAPDLPAGVNFNGFSSTPQLNNAGQVAFFGSLTGPGVDFTNDGAIWLGDGIELLNVVRDGMTVAGKTVSALGTPVAGQLNDFGQLAYWASFTDNTDGIFLFTPDLRWRQNFSSSWDNRFNWTLSINPAQLYDTRIDPSVSLTVSGPSANREVRTLEIGGGTGVATLSLFGGKITSLMDSVKVLVNGVLTGDGSVAGGVLNQGTVRAQNVTIEGGLVNEGVVTGNGRINADIANSTGRISVGSGQAMRIGGTVDNAAGGSVDVLGGELEVTGTFSNAGQLAARNAVLRFSGGLANSGQVALSFGTSDVFGNIANASAGTIVVSGSSNATFYDNLVNDAEVRVSAGSQAVYFGEVSGTGSFTGAGTHFFEGTVSPGASPGVLTMENATYTAGSSLNMQLAGLLPGIEYDRLVVTGDLVLEGGQLLVALIDGFLPQAGNVFDLLDWGTLAGTFGTLALPSLATDLAWNTSSLYVDGTISVAAIPEPETYALLLAGLGLLGFAARRRVSRKL